MSRHRVFNRDMTKTETNTWHKSYVTGSYVSTDGRFAAELRPAGYYPEHGCKLTRHYSIRYVGQTTSIGTARTLAEAERMYL